MENPTEASFVQIRNNVPRLWWNLYQGCIDCGFDPVQSFALLKISIVSQNVRGVFLDDYTTEGPKTDNPDAA